MCEIQCLVQLGLKSAYRQFFRSRALATTASQDKGIAVGHLGWFARSTVWQPVDNRKRVRDPTNDRKS